MSDSDSFCQEPIAIIGRGCCLPSAHGLDAYWQLILSGECAQRPVPMDRLNRDLLYHPEKGQRNKTYADIACLIDHPDPLATGSRLPQSLKRHPEPTFKTLASVAIDTVADAGLDPLDLPHDNVGIYIGHTRGSGLAGDMVFANYIGEVAALLEQVPAACAVLGDRLREVQQQLVETVHRDFPHRSEFALGASCSAKSISDTLRTTGPYMAFNAACASSTQAVIQAARALQTGRVEMAIAGGASCFHSDTSVLFSQSQSLSANGTRPWDAAADGLVIGEGSVTLLLCRLSDALRSGYPIHGTLVGIGLSSDGKGKSLWAPRKEGQILAIERAYRNGLSQADVGYIEAHATSTQVGDATEIKALSESYRQALRPGMRIPIGSVKANIGHTLETAGIAGLLKCLLAMQHETIPPVRHIQTPNPKIDWDAIPFELPREARDWHPGRDGWLAGVNAFGIGGLNTHLVVQRSASTARPSLSPASLPSRVQRPPIAIVGVGCILPGAKDEHGVEAFWRRVVNHTLAISEVPERRLPSAVYPAAAEPGPFEISSRQGGVIRDYAYDWRRHRVPPKQIAHASPLQFMILDAVEAAFQDAGIEIDDSNRQSIGVLTGTSFGGEFSNQLQMGLRIPELQQRLQTILQSIGLPTDQHPGWLEEFAERLLAEMPALLDETGSFTASSLSSRITKSLHLLGGAAAVDSGDGSAGAALMCGMDQLLCGDNDLMVCVGAQQDLSPARYLGMTRAGTLRPGADGDSFLPGEGCVVLLLEREQDALRNGHRIHAVIEDMAGAYATASIEQTVALAAQRLSPNTGSLKTSSPDRSTDPETVSLDSIERAASGCKTEDQTLDAVHRWSHRSCQSDGTSEPSFDDATTLVGHLSGASMGVSILAAIGHQSTAHSAHSRRLIVGGSAHQSSYQLLLKDNSK